MTNFDKLKQILIDKQQINKDISIEELAYLMSEEKVHPHDKSLNCSYCKYDDIDMRFYDNCDINLCYYGILSFLEEEV